jgi:hypothetical protein
MSPVSVASPIASGGGGTFFEQHVGAFFLAHLLIRGIPPLLRNCQITNVHFQAEHLGLNTDDVVVVGSAGSSERKIVAQVKRTFTVSSSNEASVKAFTDFWHDFKNEDKFDRSSDRFALVTLRGTNVLLNDFNGLLDCARASADGTDFARRRTVDGLVSSKARTQAEEVEKVIKDVEGQKPKEEVFWQFLKALHVISLDLHTSTALDESGIISLLAQTCREPDPIDAAKNTWNELLQFVAASNGMPAAGSYAYENLPESLRERHTALDAQFSSRIQKLVDHSDIVLDDIQTKIGGSVRVRRESLEAQTLRALEKHRIALITGKAGNGKSAVAKEVITQLRSNYYCFALRSEEFAEVHLDRALGKIQHGLTTEGLKSVLSGQDRVVFLIESIERLLESSQRKAFTDLLRLVEKTPSFHLVLTCRDYSADTVKSSLLSQSGLGYDSVSVPHFDNDELDAVAQEIPGLAPALQKQQLRSLLASPYLLSLASQIQWADGGELPETERQFRDRCWEELIRRDSAATGGMPQRRGDAFSRLSVLRAKQLRRYVPRKDLDIEAVSALRSDDLVSFSESTDALIAPAHDVLEDWAVLHWIEERFLVHERDPEHLANEIGGYPALRRGYRKWLGELLDRDIQEGSQFVLSVFTSMSLPPFFRDDTIICALLSSSAEEFLSQNIDLLLQNQASLLIRVIHLLRVACKTSPYELGGTGGLQSVHLIPTGSAWAPVLDIVRDELENLLPNHFGVVLGLVEDWAKGVSLWNPSPDGFHAAGEIVARLLDDLGGYNTGGRRQRALKVLAKIPESAPDIFIDLLGRGAAQDRSDARATDLAELVFTDVHCAFACRDLPEEVVEAALTYFCLTEEDVQEVSSPLGAYSSGTDKVSKNFGVRSHVNSKFSVPASAIRGPFYPLLRDHPNIGLDFIIRLLNHACSWYGEQKWPGDSLESAEQIELSIYGEEERVRQWANIRLYQMYRGMSVAPYSLQSVLMALEKWLLQIADAEEVNLEARLLEILKSSNNIALTAVVASLCVAYPYKCGRAGLSLLQSRTVVKFDRMRMSGDQTHTKMTSSALLPANEIYDRERQEADDLPHRNEDLEALALKLQFTERREDVQEILDKHQDALPLLEDQLFADKVWRIALHRMDLRRQELTEMSASEAGVTDSKDGKVYVGMKPTQLEPDIQEISEQTTSDFEDHSSKLFLLNWGRSVWQGKASVDPTNWEEMLAAAKEAHGEDEVAQSGSASGSATVQNLFNAGPGLVAAVCVRDHWEEMTSEDQSWCVNVLIEVIQTSDDEDTSFAYSLGAGISADRYAAHVLPYVLRKSGVENAGEKVIEAVGVALTHPVSEVRQYASDGLGYHLRDCERSFVNRCVGALSRWIRLEEEGFSEQKRKPYKKRLSLKEVVRSAVPAIRQAIVEGDIDASEEIGVLNPESWTRQGTMQRILNILSYQTDSEIAFQAFRNVSNALIQSWEEVKADRFGRRRRDYEFEASCAERMARLALDLAPPKAVSLYGDLVDALPDHPEEVSTFVRGLITEEDLRGEESSSFWDVWQSFADRLIHAPWVEDLDENYVSASGGRKLTTLLMLGVKWVDGTRYWSKLNGQESRVEALVQQLPVSVSSFRAYCRFLYHIGEESMPQAFCVVSERLRAAPAVSELLGDDNTMFYLEALLRRHVYGEPLQLKADRTLREDVIYNLEAMIEEGSSAAYKMRDDFVTPVPPQA